jgi:hypothetical protein
VIPTLRRLRRENHEFLEDTRENLYFILFYLKTPGLYIASGIPGSRPSNDLYFLSSLVLASCKCLFKSSPQGRYGGSGL